MEAFIRGIGNISPQFTYDNSMFLEDIRTHDATFMKCVEPNYKEYIKPIQMRRMGRILKMGVTAAGICLRDAGIEMLDGIIIGTGLGMMADTEKFLKSMIDNDEKFLTPTSFIQSTHNTIGAYIAVMLKCNKYNYTYVHDNLSFESALLDSMMCLEEEHERNILLGGVDELTDNYYKITDRVGFWKKQAIGNLKMLEIGDKGSIPGEGSSFFLLTGKEDPNNYAKFSGVNTFYNPESINEVRDDIIKFLETKELTIKDIDLIILGLNGDEEWDFVYRELQNDLFKDNVQSYYKHLCGEYYTSAAFASWLAVNILKRQIIPQAILLNKPEIKLPVKNILIYNHLRNINHSVILLSAC